MIYEFGFFHLTLELNIELFCVIEYILLPGFHLKKKQFLIMQLYPKNNVIAYYLFRNKTIERGFHHVSVLFSFLSLRGSTQKLLSSVWFMMQILNTSLGRCPTINQATSYVASSAIMNLIDMSAVAASNSQTPIQKSSRFEEKSRCLPHDSKLKETYGTELLLTSIALLNPTHRFRFCVPEAVCIVYLI